MSLAVDRYDCVVVGAGVAGLAAASALSGAGARVAVVERKPFVGGRAYSYPHPALQEVVDSQHVLVGCCTNLRHLCGASGIADLIRWYDGYVFLEPGGRRTNLALSGLPAPLHTSPSFAAAPMLSLRDKLAIGTALQSFVRGYPKDDSESVASWLRRKRQPDGAIRHFWRPVVISALNDTLDRCSMRYAGQVFHETFLRSAEGGRLGIPTLPLSDFYGRVAQHCEAQGGTLYEKQSVERLEQRGEEWAVHLQGGGELIAKTVISAVSFEHVPQVLGTELMTAVMPQGVAGFCHSPITSIHLWYEREFTTLDHAALLDTGIEWMFHKSRIRRSPAGQGSYLELTISASHAQLKESRETLLTRSLRELESFFPEARTTKLLKSGVLKEAKATFSVLPGMDRLRPAQETAVPGLVLAGDWTQTGWPSTMEGGVRSGYLAAEAVARQLGSSRSFVQPDLAAAGLMRWLARE
ncbi:hydroxysqualene dehydroxylase HpnE [Terriglobus aquaticus]|uniref:Hydroxysqualene dehydroxylase HpnE n=1 Tax=Terriglobus aquaticus TaxID=940139 RepID=A0ABW9KLZ2_9BACT|nr:hydroxysqualene dehydroxylase HpnE [Terriglobus aquaticus]